MTSVSSEESPPHSSEDHTIQVLSCDRTLNGFTLTNQYLLGPSGEQVTELDGSGTWVHTNVYAAGSLIATYDNDNKGVHFHLSDWLGTRRAQTNYAGALEATYTSLPFGDGLVTTAGLDPTEHHFTGKERDAESSLDYFGARYYASNMGRFMSPDWAAQAEPVPYATLDDPQSLNLYGYVRNNPLSRLDPDGHKQYDRHATSWFGFPDGDSVLDPPISAADAASRAFASGGDPYKPCVPGRPNNRHHNPQRRTRMVAFLLHRLERDQIGNPAIP